ncbi:hypothetical protein A3Q56_02484 [Intoshia linei]|uniref:SWI/SNF complex subunit SMARCC2 n=1 Tax=Intoshia linei TaxID=1819745 RepID=A0A177B657_9BILA|nr:hypothetical protein A3Q56_02484 [Intoshia linei]
MSSVSEKNQNEEINLKRNNSKRRRSESQEPIIDENYIKDVEMKEPVSNEQLTKVDLSRDKFVKNSNPSLNSDSMYLDLDNMANYKSNNFEEPCEQLFHILVPSYSAWFDYNSIHAIERKCLSEFFATGGKSKTPEIYLASRNFMIDTYRLNPNDYLTFTACRRNLCGDVCSLLRIHAFLEMWGLINYKVSPELRPKMLGPPRTSHFAITAEAPSSLQPLSDPQTLPKTENPNNNAVNIAAPKNNFNEQNTRTDLYGKSDEVKSKNSKYREWDSQEILRLLEGLEMYSDDWNKVSEHVGSRNQDECILHFLKLPIEDPYLEESKSLGPMSNQPFPFSSTGNPVMSTLAFLSSAVDPQIAAAAAKAAFDEYYKIQGKVPNSFMNAHKKKIEDVISTSKKIDTNLAIKDTGIATDEDSDKTVEKTDEKNDNVSSGTVENDNLPKTEKDKIDVKIKEVDPVKENGKTSYNEAWNEENSKNLAQAAASALAAAAVKAKHLASVEEGRIKTLVASLVETQNKKLEVKLDNFGEMEKILEKQRDTLRAQRDELLKQRQIFHLEQTKASDFRARQEQELIKKSKQLSQTINNMQVLVPETVIGYLPMASPRISDVNYNKTESNGINGLVNGKEETKVDPTVDPNVSSTT